MNEFNIDEEEPDKHWEGFKRLLFWIAAIVSLLLFFIFA